METKILKRSWIAIPDNWCGNNFPYFCTFPMKLKQLLIKLLDPFQSFKWSSWVLVQICLQFIVFELSRLPRAFLTVNIKIIAFESFTPLFTCCMRLSLITLTFIKQSMTFWYAFFLNQSKAKVHVKTLYPFFTKKCFFR